MTTAHLKAILEQHRGMQNAIRVKELAILLGMDERKVRELKRELAEEMLIGSSCDRANPGYYVPVCEEEITATLANYYARIRSLFALVKATKGAPEMERFIRQLRLEFKEAS